jgi:curved DNA-binding protein CbpA
VRTIRHRFNVLSCTLRVFCEVTGAAGFGGMPGGGGFHHFSQGDAFKVFQAFFGGGGGGFGGFGGHEDEDEDMGHGFGGASMFGGPGMASMFSGGMPMRAGGGVRRPRGPRKDPPVMRDLPVSLEDLYTGVHKKLKITRQRLGGDGKPHPEEKILEIDVKPGWKAGTKITFEEEGDAGIDRIPADIVFTIAEKPHPRFERDGEHLIYNARIPLKDALAGTELEIVSCVGGLRSCGSRPRWLMRSFFVTCSCRKR